MVKAEQPRALALGNDVTACALKVAPEAGAPSGSGSTATRVLGSKNRNNITLSNDVIISAGQSLTHRLVHAIFSTKDRRPFLCSEEIRTEIYAYMAGTLKNLDCHPIKIGGVEDHVHVFSSLSKNIAFSDLIGRLKGASSKRLKEKGLSDFSWQNGYGAFSVSADRREPLSGRGPSGTLPRAKALGCSVRPFHGQYAANNQARTGF